MYCSNCGMDIPFGGNVCPFCKADKRSDQQQHAQLMLTIGGCTVAVAFVVGIISEKAAPGTFIIGGLCFGVPIGFVVGLVVAFVLMIVNQPRQQPAPPRPAKYRVQCPNCKAVGNVLKSDIDDRQRPARIKCPKCGVPFAVDDQLT